MSANANHLAEVMPMSGKQAALVRSLTLLFWFSFALIIAHIVDDTIIGEPSAWGLSLFSYWVLNASWFLLLPTFGWALARRGYRTGFLIVLAFSLLALLGAGTDHLRHLTSDFRINTEITDMLGGMGIGNTDLYARSFLGTLYWLLGLATSQPHAHTLFSTMLIMVSSGTYIVLGVASVMGLWAFRGYRGAVDAANRATTQPQGRGCACGILNDLQPETTDNKQVTKGEFD